MYFKTKGTVTVKETVQMFLLAMDGKELQMVNIQQLLSNMNSSGIYLEGFL